MSLNSSPVVEYEYDSSSRLLQRVEGGTTTNYIWDGWDLVREEKSGAVTETTEYLCPEGEVLAFKRGGDWYYLHGDALSSTQLVTDESGAVVGRYVYGAWGEELSATESVPGLFENRFVGGLGCRRDSATGLVYMRHRWYDPELGRFISRDPIGFAGGLHLYNGASTSPVTMVDPTGLTLEFKGKHSGDLVKLLEKLSGLTFFTRGEGIQSACFMSLSGVDKRSQQQKYLADLLLALMGSSSHHTVTVDNNTETIFGRFIGTGNQGIDVGDMSSVHRSGGMKLATALMAHDLTELYNSTDGRYPATTESNWQSVYESLHRTGLETEANLMGSPRTGESYDKSTGKGTLQYGDKTFEFTNKKGSFKCKWR